MIYKIFGLYPQFQTNSAPNPWNFLSIENGKKKKVVSCYVNDVTFGKHLRGGGRTWLAMEPTLVMRGLELSALLPELWGGERGWSLKQSPTASDSVNQDHVTKPP